MPPAARKSNFLGNIRFRCKKVKGNRRRLYDTLRDSDLAPCLTASLAAPPRRGIASLLRFSGRSRSRIPDASGNRGSRSNGPARGGGTRSHRSVDSGGITASNRRVSFSDFSSGYRFELHTVVPERSGRGSVPHRSTRPVLCKPCRRRGWLVGLTRPGRTSFPDVAWLRGRRGSLHLAPADRGLG